MQFFEIITVKKFWRRRQHPGWNLFRITQHPHFLVVTISFSSEREKSIGKLPRSDFVVTFQGNFRPNKPNVIIIGNPLKFSGIS